MLHRFRHRLCLSRRARRSGKPARICRSWCSDVESPQGSIQIRDDAAGQCRGPSHPRCARPRSHRRRARSAYRECSDCGSKVKRSCEASTWRRGETIGNAHMVHAQPLRQRLQLTMPVGDTNRADVIAFGKQQFEQSCGDIVSSRSELRGHFHAFFHSGHARGQQLVDALDFDQAQTARANLREALQVAERGNEYIVLPAQPPRSSRFRAR